MLPALEKEKKEEDVYTEIRIEKKEAGKKDVVVEIGIYIFIFLLISRIRLNL